jgi:3-dehydroquinate synthase
MKRITVKIKDNPYDIVIGCNLLKKAGLFINRLKVGNQAYIVTHQIINNNFGKILKDSLEKEGIRSVFKIVKDTEKTKSIYISIRLIKDILKIERSNNTFIIALGGGVIGDLVGFTASIYKRGIPYIQIPTTLLGQIDSGIGGKTAVDLKEAKNIIGTFYQPSLVLNDISLLKTLNTKNLRSGLAEAIKYGIIKDGFILDYIQSYLKNIFMFDEKILEEIVWRCAKIKKEIVEIDEKEKKMIRTILNFGHTIGHALETASGYRGYTHGEAISIGMLVALEIGVILGITKEDLLKRIEDLLKNVGLPTRIDKKISLEKIIQAYYHDKKFKGVKNRFVLIKDIGKPIIEENIPLNLIKKVIIKRFS